MSKKSIEVIILAAGKGSRMKSALPKVLHEVAGLPLLGHVIEAAAKLEPSAIHIVVGHGKEQVKERFAQHPHSAIINWVEQKQQLGTGHAVQQVMPQIGDTSLVLMLTADVPLISSNTLLSVVNDLTGFALVLLTADVDDPTGLGRIIRDDTQGVSEIVEEKDATTTQRNIREINSGIMGARARELKLWLSELGNKNAQGEYYLTDIVAIASRQGNPVAAIQAENSHEVEGINSRVQLAQVERIYQLQRAQQLMMQGVTIIDPARVDIRGNLEIGSDTTLDINTVIIGPCKIGNNVHIAPNCVINASDIGDGSQIHANTVMDNAVVGDNVNVGPFARLRPGTLLANDVRIGNFVETKNAKLGEGAKVNHLSYVGDASVGAQSNIGAGVITCNYDGANKHQTTIGDDVFVGSNSVLVAPIELDKGAFIGAGSTITRRVESGQLAISRAKQRQIDGWHRPTKKDQKT